MKLFLSNGSCSEKTLDDATLEEVNRFARQQYHSLITCMNALSLVCDCNDRFVFMGDAPADVVDYLHNQGLFADEYTFVKIQHHGTTLYYTPQTPRGQNRLISNGGYHWRKVDDHFVILDQTICTNGHDSPGQYCKYYISHRACAPACNPIGAPQITPV